MHDAAVEAKLMFSLAAEGSALKYANASAKDSRIRPNLLAGPVATEATNTGKREDPERRWPLLQPNEPTPWVIDGHAHFYPWMNGDLALDAAHSNFSRIRRRSGLPLDGPDVLALVDPSWQRSAGGLDVLGDPRTTSRWLARTCEDGISLKMTRKADGAMLFIVSGRQVRANCGLEVLAFATTEPFADGMPFSESVAQMLQCVGFAILPWGFGKWLGYRGQKAVDALRSAPESRLFVGDNSGRPFPYPTPPLFRLCRRLGVPILPGSDPLPFRGQERKLGRYGFLLTGGFDPDAPGHALRDSLNRLSTQPRIVGTREGLVSFLLSQGIQLSSRIFSKLKGRSSRIPLDE